MLLAGAALPERSGPAPQFCKIDFVYTCKLTMEFFHFCNGLCYNWQEAITLNSFHLIPFYWVVWSLFSIKDLKEFRNGFFFCPAISFSCRALGGYFSRTPILLLKEMFCPGFAPRRRRPNWTPITTEVRQTNDNNKHKSESFRLRFVLDAAFLTGRPLLMSKSEWAVTWR